MNKTSWTYSIKLYMKYKMYDEDCLKFKMLRGGGNTTPPHSWDALTILCTLYYLISTYNLFGKKRLTF